MPENYPLSLYRGDTERWQFRLWTDAAHSVPADLAGVVAKAEIRERPGGEHVTPMGCTITGNYIDMVLTAEDCGQLPSKGVWDLQLTYAGGDVLTILSGEVVVAPGVTDSTPQTPTSATASPTTRAGPRRAIAR